SSLDSTLNPRSSSSVAAYLASPGRELALKTRSRIWGSSGSATLTGIIPSGHVTVAAPLCVSSAAGGSSTRADHAAPPPPPSPMRSAMLATKMRRRRYAYALRRISSGGAQSTAGSVAATRFTRVSRSSRMVALRHRRIEREEIGECPASSEQPRLHRAHRRAGLLRDVGDRKADEVVQGQRDPLFLGQRTHGRDELKRFGARRRLVGKDAVPLVRLGPAARASPAARRDPACHQAYPRLRVVVPADGVPSQPGLHE